MLGSIGIGVTLSVGCIGTPSSGQTVSIVSSKQVSSEDFRRVSSEEIAEDADAVISEVADEDAVYIYRTLQLPTPSHKASHTVENGESDSTVNLRYTAESNLEDDQRSRSVIQPLPYVVKIQFAQLHSDITINIITIPGTQIRYRTTKTKSTTAISENSQA